MKKYFVWDLPTRVFHWSLAVLFGVSILTGFNGGLNAMDYHMLSGYTIITLVGFRLLWGIVGSKNSRFLSFIRGPGAIFAHIRTLADPAEGYAGHNPLGALSIIAMLLALAVQTATGLFSTDDVFVDGPLQHLVSHENSLFITSIHKTNLWILIALVGLHLAAIAWYQLIRKENLLLPMITGWKRLETAVVAERNNWLLAIVLLGAVAGGVYYLINFV